MAYSHLLHLQSPTQIMRVIFFIIFLLVSVMMQAQKNKKSKESDESYYAFDSTWTPCKVEKAKYLAFVQHIDDTTWQWNFYKYTGPLINIETYRDKDGKIPYGYFAWFDDEGYIDSSGNTLNGRKHGDWYYYSNKPAVDIHEKYENGKLIKREVPKDSAKKDKSDLKPGEVEASFKGGIGAWKKYLEKNYTFPQRALKGDIDGTVQVLFTIDTSGNVIQPRILKSVELTTDKEVIRVINASPPWIPAVQDGRKVKAYRIQPFMTSVTSN
jgi:periplasmic protein TonB